MKKIFKSLKPTYADAGLTVYALLLVCVLFTPEFLCAMSLNRFNLGDNASFSEGSLVFFPVLAFLIPIAASLGTFSKEKLVSFKWFVALIVGSMVVLGATLFREGYLDTNDSGLLSSPDTLVIFALIVATFPLTWILSKLTYLLVKKFVSFSAKKTMIVGALAMFAVLTARNISGNGMEEVTAKGILGLGQLSYVCGLGMLLLGIVPAIVLTKIRGAKAFLFAMVYFPFLAASLHYLTPTIFSFSAVFLPVLAFGIVSYVTIMLLTAKPKVEDERQNRWSLFGWFIVVASLTLVIVGWNYSLITFMMPGKGNIELARTTKRLSTTPGMTARLEPWLASMIYGEIAYADNCDPEVLKQLEGTQFNVWLWHYNLHPGINTSYLKNATKRVSCVNDSAVTMNQLNDLANGCTQIYIRNTSIVFSDTAQDKVPILSAIELTQMKSGETEKFLDAIDKNVAGDISVRGFESLSNQDWIALLEASRDCNVQIFEKLPLIVLTAASQSADQFKLRFSTLPEPETREFWQLALDTTLCPLTPGQSPFEDTRHFWDLAFASKSNGIAEWFVKETPNLANGKTFQSQAENSNWIFSTEKDEQGNDVPKGLIAPIVAIENTIESIYGASELLELEQLSFDPRWIPSLRTMHIFSLPLVVDFAPVGNLTKLKRLDLPTTIWVKDVNFTKHLTNLEELQVDTRHWKNQMISHGLSASNLGNLKSLIIFGPPSKFLATEIAKMPSLENLTIVLGKANFTEAVEEKINSNLGDNIKANFELETQFVAKPPTEFTEHIEAVRKRLRNEHLESTQSTDETK